MLSFTWTLWLAIVPVAGQDAKDSPVQFSRELDLGGRAVTVDFGRLSVPQLAEKPDAGPELALAFARLRTTAREPGPPLFLLPGGHRHDREPVRCADRRSRRRR